jgi:hypothetical protein
LANINRNWRRIVAIGCSHGELIHPKVFAACCDFADRYKPHRRVHLGDNADFAAYRGGARGTRDEHTIARFRPTDLTEGNHDARARELCRHPNEMVRHSAQTTCDEIDRAYKKYKVNVLPYDVRRGWLKIGAHWWGHGYRIGANAVINTTKDMGGPVVMAHLHRTEQVAVPTFQGNSSFCVGTQMDIDLAEYAKRWPSILGWKHGMLFGEYTEDRSQLWLVSSEPGEIPRFPL